MKGKIVLPGDKLSTSEELLAGDGTYEEDGIIRAYRMGFYDVDDKRHTAMVKPLTSVPVVVKKGDIILAHAASVRSMMVIADVFHVIGKKRAISGDTNGTIHASEISRSYVKDASTEYKVGDIVRARIFQVKPSIQLTTKDRELGVIKALCTKCRHVMDNKGNDLECNNCRNRERRKIAQDYGTVDLEKL